VAGPGARGARRRRGVRRRRWRRAVARRRGSPGALIARARETRLLRVADRLARGCRRPEIESSASTPVGMPPIRATGYGRTIERHLALLCNPAAGGGRAARVLPRVEDALRSLGLSFHTEVTRDLEHARSLAAHAAQAGEVTVTLGGDGLVGCVGGALREHPGALLAVLPGGRGNDFARSLGIPKDLAAACAVVASGIERDLDVGDVGGRPFIGIASLGFDSDANRIANAAPARLGNLAYVYGGLRALAGWERARFALHVDGAPLDLAGYSVAACNAPYYGGGMHLAPGARLDDGLLDVVLVAHMPKRRYLVALPGVFKGRHVANPAVSVLRARELRVDADRPFQIYADGDPIGETPATITVVPRALRVLAPA
jgi:YegS/Rv2252/BmrU family lipid kinase